MIWSLAYEIRKIKPTAITYGPHHTSVQDTSSRTREYSADFFRSRLFCFRSFFRPSCAVRNLRFFGRGPRRRSHIIQHERYYWCARTGRKTPPMCARYVYHVSAHRHITGFRRGTKTAVAVNVRPLLNFRFGRFPGSERRKKGREAGAILSRPPPSMRYTFETCFHFVVSEIRGETVAPGSVHHRRRRQSFCRVTARAPWFMRWYAYVARWPASINV